MNLFAYGTLMCENIMIDVAGCTAPRAEALLQGYLRCAVSGEAYPALTPREGASVRGTLYRNLPDSAWPLLDRFEGDMYRREDVLVSALPGEELQAVTYIVKPEFVARREENKWSFSEFLKTGKDLFGACEA